MISVAIDDRVRAAVQGGAIVAHSISAGKDSSASMREANAFLDSIGHPRSRRIAVHADLGRAEWQSTPATVERIAAAEGLELMVVARQAGDLVHRFEQRWTNGKARYLNLETYNLIGPWPQADKRFCTAELKQQVIAPALAKRFRGETIVSVVGLRRDESTGRRRTPISKVETRYAKPGNRAGTSMLTWFPAVDWTTEDVFACHARHGIELHEAYTTYGSSRLSCAFCILASIRDLKAAASAAGNVEVYLYLVALEARSTFSFQGQRWLGDVAPSLLPDSLRRDLDQAKLRAEERRAIEAAMPAGLRYVKGWPQRLPTIAEAEEIAAARIRILAHHQLEARFVTADVVVARFAELLDAKARKLEAQS